MKADKLKIVFTITSMIVTDPRLTTKCQKILNKSPKIKKVNSECNNI